jgi:hypothetical protein
MSNEDLLNIGLTQDEVDQIRDYRSALLEENKTLMEIRTTITDKVI